MPYNFIWQHYCISRCCCCFCFHLLLKPPLSFSACVSSIHLKLCFHNTGYMIMFIDFSKAFVHFTNCLFISMLRHYSVVLKTNTYPSHLTLLFTSVYAVIFFVLLIVIFHHSASLFISISLLLPFVITWRWFEKSVTYSRISLFPQLFIGDISFVLSIITVLSLYQHNNHVSCHKTKKTLLSQNNLFVFFVSSTVGGSLCLLIEHYVPLSTPELVRRMPQISMLSQCLPDICP